MRFSGWAVGAGVMGGAVMSFCIILRSASAEPKPGLWLEGVTHADGVTIRKIRDTTGGDHNVCYVASWFTLNVPAAVAISASCLPEKNP